MEFIDFLKMIGGGASAPVLVVGVLVFFWRIDKRLGRIESWVKHHESTTDLRMSMLEKEFMRELDAIRDRIDKESRK